jgi:hypothetical protein
MTLGNRFADPALIVIAVGGEGSDGGGNLVEKRVHLANLCRICRRWRR